MLLIVVLGLIAKLASVSAECDVAKTVQDFDFNKVSSVMAVFGFYRFEFSQGYGCLSLVCCVFHVEVSSCGQI